MKKILPTRWLLALLALLNAGFLLGCGEAKITGESGSGTPAGAPKMIYILNFDLGSAAVQADPGTFTGRTRVVRIFAKDPATELQELQDLLASTLVEDLHKQNLPARRLAPGESLPQSGWTVRGEFLEVNEGNRMQKAVVGFGAGNSETTLLVSVADLSRAPGQNLLDFNLDSTGSVSPSGAGTVALTHEPYAMAAKFVMSRDASEKDIKHAAGEIADRLKKLAQATPAK